MKYYGLICVPPPDSYDESWTSKVTIFADRTCEEVIQITSGCMGGPLINRTGAFITKFSVLSEEKPCEKVAICKAGGEPSPEVALAWPLILGLQPPEMWENTFLLCKPPSGRCLLWQPKQTIQVHFIFLEHLPCPRNCLAQWSANSRSWARFVPLPISVTEFHWGTALLITLDSLRSCRHAAMVQLGSQLKQGWLLKPHLLAIWLFAGKKLPNPGPASWNIAVILYSYFRFYEILFFGCCLGEIMWQWFSLWIKKSAWLNHQSISDKCAVSFHCLIGKGQLSAHQGQERLP